MINYPRNLAVNGTGTPVIRIVGLGNAGINITDRVTMGERLPAEVIAMNSDLQSLTSSVAPKKIVLGRQVTRGLGAGGDPEIGWQSARESETEIRDAVAGADVVFLCVGLGGGTASGAAPAVAGIVKDAGAMLVVIATSPFSFEGRRRAQQAVEALAALSKRADAMVHFENDRMSELTVPKSGIEDTFAASDATLVSCIASVVRILASGGPMRIGVGDLLAVLKDGDALCLFGHGEGNGDNRAHDALARAFKHPLLDRGRMLEEADTLLAHISGPPSLSFAEVGAIMQEVSRHTAEHAKIFLGVSAGRETSASVHVTLIGKYPAPAHRMTERTPTFRPMAEAPPAPRPVTSPRAEPPMEPEPEPRELIEDFATLAEPPEDEPAPPVREAPKAPPKPQPAKIRQETLQFEPVARGRFEKSEPTIVEGEDLDVPTFLRIRSKSK